ncbi:MAG: paraquat-inducible protein A [Alphaproteobacteria bacterium]|nr:paraquat-inducible protein A [Alphaproteobacteria bacterium]
MNTKSSNLQPETANTLAGQQRGLTRLIGPLLAMTLVALPISWHLPLFRTELLVFLENEVTLLGAVITLAETDLFLCAIVVLFGMAIPFMKLLALLYAWFALPQARAQSWINTISKISKFSMLDVMLIAIVIVGLKGVGMGKVTVEYGLYAYASVVIFALLLSSWMQVVAGRNVTAAVAQS